MEIYRDIVQTAQRYETYCSQVSMRLKRSSVPREVLCDRLGLSRSQVYKKIRAEKWRPEELAMLAEILEEQASERGRDIVSANHSL